MSILDGLNDDKLALIDRLPKTADGVRVVPNMEVFQPDLCGQGVNVLDVQHLTAYSRDSIPNPHYYFGGCYSTETAALAAQEAKPQGICRRFAP